MAALVSIYVREKFVCISILQQVFDLVVSADALSMAWLTARIISKTILKAAAGEDCDSHVVLIPRVYDAVAHRLHL